MSETQTIWIAEFAPKPHLSSVGGFNWYHLYCDAHTYLEDELLRIQNTHDIALYSVTLPAAYSTQDIQTWCEDHTNIIPLHENLSNE